MQTLPGPVRLSWTKSLSQYSVSAGGISMNEMFDVHRIAKFRQQMCILCNGTIIIWFLFILHSSLSNNNNKFVQSNLGRGQRRGTVAHLRSKVPIGYNGAPQIRPQKYPLT